MLGKQWVNRYSTTKVRGSTVDHSRDRQRKLDGIHRWCFDSVMESLPIMLQVALLLLGCALSRYIWEISRTVASVVIGVTSFGLLFYLFILIVGSVLESCPYQTPGSLVLRYLALKTVPSAAGNAFSASKTVGGVARKWSSTYWSSFCSISIFFLELVIMVPFWFASDIYHLGRGPPLLLRPTTFFASVSP